MKNKVLTVLPIFLLIVFLSGCTSPRSITTPEGNITVEKGSGISSWCSAGTKITTTGPQGQGQATFIIKGLTTHNGTEVCQAEYIYDQGSMTYYFNEKKDYMFMVIKDKAGNILQEMNFNPTSMGVNPNS